MSILITHLFAANAIAGPTTTVLAITPGTTVVTGTPVTISATVSGGTNYTSQIEIIRNDNFASIDGCPPQAIPNGSTTFTATCTTQLAPGIYQFRAHYLGDGVNDPSNSQPQTLIVNDTNTTFNVDSLLDDPDADPNDGQCLTAAGTCTLRAALQQTAVDPNLRVTINLPTGQIMLQSALPTIVGQNSRRVTINGVRGPGKTHIVQTSANSVLESNGNYNLFLNDLTIRGGSSPTTGGGLNLQAINSLAIVNLNRVIVRNNTAVSHGGGIFADSRVTLTLSRSEVSNNTVTGVGGRGGGIFIDTLFDSQSATITSSTIAENQAFGVGGIFSDQPITITNSTISGNRGNQTSGLRLGPRANTLLTNVTIANNSAATPPSTASQLFNETTLGNAVNFRNVILAAPQDGTVNCGGNLSVNIRNHNLSSDNSCAGIWGVNDPTNLHNTNPMLAALAPSSTPFSSVRVHKLLAGSPAINAGSFVAGSGTVDQEDNARVVGPAQDIGAVEFFSPAPVITSGAPPANIPVGQPFTFTFTATGTPAPTFVLQGVLPIGLTLNPTTGVLSGTPPLDSGGTFTGLITVTATNGVNPDSSISFTLSFAEVNVAPAFTGGTQPHSIVAGQPFSFPLTASGTPAPEFGLNGAPAWVALGGVDSNFVTGTAPMNLAGTTVPITVTATNNTGTIQATIDLIITAAPAAPQFMTLADVETMAVGETFTKPFTVTGSPTPTLTAPVLPAWLTFNPATGTFTGIPQSAGDYPVTITATNTAGTVSQSFIISVKPLIVIQPPEKPVGLTCAGAGQSITCSLPMSSDADNYMLTCTNGATLAEARVLGPESPFVLSGLVRGSTYACRVVAYNAGGASPASDAVTITLPDAAPAWRPTTVDINGDAAPDVLVSGNGNVLRGSFDGHRLNFVPLAFLSNNIRVLGAGDFNGEHRADVLFRDLATGDVKLWRADAVNPPKGSGETGTERFVRNVKDGWSVEAIADIDGDGRNDIVWRYVTPNTPDSGVVYVWYMADNVVTEVRSRGGAPLTWDLVGAADLNGDGMAELVWVSPANEIRSLTAKSQKAFVNEKIGTVPSGFKLMRAADFNGDGKADFLFGDTNGNLRLWTMNGLTRQAEIQLPAADPTWELYAIVDLNGDGAMDIVWKQPDGRLQAWFMNTQNLAAPIMLNYAGDAPQGTQSVNP
jgi:hypothetical protein